jgi:ribosomal protein L20A (L18A)
MLNDEEIVDVTVYPDDDVPESMMGIHRIGGVEIMYRNGELKFLKELVDNTEYYSQAEMLQDVSKRLGVNIEIIHIDGE